MQNKARYPKTYIARLPLIGLILLYSVAGCTSNTQTLTGAERDAVLAYAEPMTDNLLEGWNRGAYATLSRNFNEEMSQALDEASFRKTRGEVLDRVGAYVSRQVDEVLQQGDLVVVIYRGQFEKDDNVTIRVVFQASGDHQIAGLWFDSPRLRR